MYSVVCANIIYSVSHKQDAGIYYKTKIVILWNSNHLISIVNSFGYPILAFFNG